MTGNLLHANILLQEQLELTQGSGSAGLKSRAIKSLSSLNFQQGDYVNSGRMIQDDFDLKMVSIKTNKKYKSSHDDDDESSNDMLTTQEVVTCSYL